MDTLRDRADLETGRQHEVVLGCDWTEADGPIHFSESLVRILLFWDGLCQQHVHASRRAINLREVLDESTYDSAISADSTLCPRQPPCPDGAIMTDTTAELNELFLATFPNGLPKDILAELQSILRIHLITAEELFYKWESYSMKMGEEVKLNMETVRGFKQDVQEALERESRGKVGRQTEKRVTVTATPRAAAGTDVFGMYGDDYTRTYGNWKS